MGRNFTTQFQRQKLSNKKAKTILVFLMPIIVVLVGIVVAFALIPDSCQGMVWFIDWLLNDSQNNPDTAQNIFSMLKKNQRPTRFKTFLGDMGILFKRFSVLFY